MVVRKEVCLTQSEWYVMDCLWAYAPQTVMQLATDLSQRAGWAQEHHHHHSGADGGQGTGPQHTRGPGQAVSPMCAAGGGSKVGGLLLPGLYLSGECGADGVHHGGWQAAIQQRVARLGEGDRPQKAALGRVAVLLTLAAVLAFGAVPPPHTATPGMRQPWRTLGPSISQRRQSPARGILP